MPSEEECQAGEDAVAELKWPTPRLAAFTAIKAAEKVRGVSVSLTEEEAHWLGSYLSPESDESATAEGIKNKVNLAIGSVPQEARTQDIHTCHAECPCQTGGEPVSDFLEARTPAHKTSPGAGEVIVVLTVAEAKCLHGEYIEAVGSDFLKVERSAQDKLAAAIEQTSDGGSGSSNAPDRSGGSRAVAEIGIPSSEPPRTFADMRKGAMADPAEWKKISDLADEYRQTTGITPDRGFAGKPETGVAKQPIPDQTSDKGAGSGNAPDEGANEERGCLGSFLPRHSDPPGHAMPLSEPIPDEAARAMAAVLPHLTHREITTALTAALPHLEAAWRQRHDSPHMRDVGIEAAIRADERAKVRERVEALKQNDPGEFYVGYDEAIGDALAAIDEGEQDDS